MQKSFRHVAENHGITTFEAINKNEAGLAPMQLVYLEIEIS